MFSTAGAAVHALALRETDLTFSTASRSADLTQSGPTSLRRFQRVEQLFHRHPPAEIRIYEPCPDNAVSPDDKCSWYRQHPGIVTLIIGKRSTI